MALQQLQPVRLRDRRGSRGAAEPGVGVLKVAVDRVLAEHEALRDLGVRETLRDQPHDLELALSEELIAWHGGRGRRNRYGTISSSWTR